MSEGLNVPYVTSPGLLNPDIVMVSIPQSSLLSITNLPKALIVYYDDYVGPKMKFGLLVEIVSVPQTLMFKVSIAELESIEPLN